MDKPLIMVVDDDRGIADEIARKIKNTDRYETIAAYSAKEALSHLAKNKILLGLGGNRIKVIILDIKMPEMDGLQFLEKVRKDYGPDIGITMLTAYEDEEKWDRSTSGFVINYIKKPFKFEELIETVDRFFKGFQEEGKMVLETFEKHINKKEEWKKEKRSE